MHIIKKVFLSAAGRFNSAACAYAAEEYQVSPNTHKKSRESPFLLVFKKESLVFERQRSAFLSASCPLELFLIVTHRRLLMMELIGFIR